MLMWPKPTSQKAMTQTFGNTARFSFWDHFNIGSYRRKLLFCIFLKKYSFWGKIYKEENCRHWNFLSKRVDSKFSWERRSTCKKNGLIFPCHGLAWSRPWARLKIKSLETSRNVVRFPELAASMLVKKLQDHRDLPDLLVQCDKIE